MSLAESSGKVPAYPVTQREYRPSPSLSRRRALGTLLVAGGSISMLAGAGVGIYVNKVEARLINRLAEQAFPAPSRNDLKQAQDDLKRATKDAQAAAGQAVASGETVTLTPPTYLVGAREVIAREDRHDAEWQRLATERGFWDKNGAGFYGVMYGAFALIVGWIIKDSAASQIGRERSEFQRTT